MAGGGGNWFWKGCKPNSVCPESLRGRESFVSAADTRNPSRVGGTWSGPLRDSLFGLAPDGVFRAASLALRAVRSYRTFSPLPAPLAKPGRFVFCGTVRRKTSRFSARVYLNRTGLSYAASRPAVFGLSSSGRPEAILRPSKTKTKISALAKISSEHYV